MDWNEFAKEVHQNAVDHGWWDKPLIFADIAVMCHSELSEAVEEYRLGNPLVWWRCMVRKNLPICPQDGCAEWQDGKCKRDAAPGAHGVAVELADCIIRILDYLAAEGDDIGDFVPAKVCGGDTIQTIAKCHYFISLAYIDDVTKAGCNWIVHSLKKCIKLILGWSEVHNVDMESVLCAKHEYNKGRPYQHGGKLL